MSVPGPATKAELRTRGQARRRERCLTGASGGASGEVAARSAAISGHLLGDRRWQAAASVAAFVGVKGEPDTRELLARTLAAGKRLWLPRMTRTRPQRIEFVAVTELAALSPAPFGLLEPGEGPGLALADLELDLIIVPGLAFTPAGLRLGYGKGHYDLAMTPLRARPRPLRVGMCFADELIPTLPAEPHDVEVHAVVTDHGMTECMGR